MNASISNRISNTTQKPKSVLKSSQTTSLNNSTNKCQTYHPHNQYSYVQIKPEINDFSPLMEMIETGAKSQKITVKRSSRGFGFVIRAIKVFYGDSDFYTIQHLVVQIDQQGPAFTSGLKINDIITHVNDEIVCGKMHSEIVQLMMASLNHTLILKTVSFDQSNIKTGGRKRSPSRNKFMVGYTPIHSQQLSYNITPNDLNKHKNYSNSLIPCNFQNYYHPSENQIFCNPMVSAFSVMSNPCTRNSSTSSLVSTSSRRSLGATVNDLYPYYNGGLLQPSYQAQGFLPPFLPPQVPHPLHINNSQTFIAPCQPVAQERKKVPCLRRKLSERYANAHKSELQRQFQLQNQTQHSSSSSSSSSLNSSINLKQRANLSPKLNQITLTLPKKETEGSFKKVEKKFK